MNSLKSRGRIRLANGWVAAGFIASISDNCLIDGHFPARISATDSMTASAMYLSCAFESP